MNLAHYKGLENELPKILPEIKELFTHIFQMKQCRTVTNRSEKIPT